MELACGTICGSIRADVTSSKTGCRIEWIVGNDFNMPQRKELVINSPFFLFGNDAWCLGLHIDAWIYSVENNVKLCVRNRNASWSTRVLVKLGIVGRDEELAIVNGRVDGRGLFKHYQWMSTRDFGRIVDECNGRLIIFCELEKWQWRQAKFNPN